MSRRAGPCLPPTAAIWPPAIATSPVKAGFPLPSITVPPRMTISCIFRLPGGLRAPSCAVAAAWTMRPAACQIAPQGRTGHGQGTDRDGVRGRRDPHAEPAGPPQRAVGVYYGGPARGPALPCP